MGKIDITGLLKELRKASGLKQSHVAKILNVERSGISKIESGIPALSEEAIKKMASIFNINPDFIDGKADNAFLRESLLTLKIKHNVNLFESSILEGSSMLLPFLLMLNTQRMSFVFLLKKFKVEYIIARDELDSIFVMEIAFNLKLDDAIRDISRGVGTIALAERSKGGIPTKGEKISIRALPLTHALSEKLGNTDALKRDDVLYCFDAKKREFSDLEKMLIDLVRHKYSIRDMVFFLKGMGLK